MIPGLLCALQRAELPECRVARGRSWCRRVEVLQQVLPNSWLTSSVCGSQREFSPTLFSSPSSSSGSRSSVPGDAQRRPSLAPNLRTESPGAADRGCSQLCRSSRRSSSSSSALMFDADVLPVFAFAVLCRHAPRRWTAAPPSSDSVGPTTSQCRPPAHGRARAGAAEAAPRAQRVSLGAVAIRTRAFCPFIVPLAFARPGGLADVDIVTCVYAVGDMIMAANACCTAARADPVATAAGYAPVGPPRARTVGSDAGQVLGRPTWSGPAAPIIMVATMSDGQLVVVKVLRCVASIPMNVDIAAG